MRHGKSEWNEKGLWTGHTDVDLVQAGREEARQNAQAFQDVLLHEAHTSMLKRTHQTLDEVVDVLGQKDLLVYRHEALNERHYGIHTGKNKWEVKEEVGEDHFHRIRRGWDEHIPEGETLKVVHDRVVPYYQNHIRPSVIDGKNVLVVAHGNTLRALIKHLEGLSEDEVAELEVGTNEVHEYAFDEQGPLLPRRIHK